MTGDDLRPSQSILEAEGFDDEIREVVYELLDAALWVKANRGYYDILLNKVLAHPRALELVDCLTRMAVGGFLEYYHGDDGWVAAVITHERDLCEELQNVVADDLRDPED